MRSGATSRAPATTSTAQLLGEARAAVDRGPLRRHALPGIHVDPADGLLSQGADGFALTWMDARVNGVPVTQRAGKAVEINALWINGLAAVAGLLEGVGGDASRLRRSETQARSSFASAFPPGDRGCADVLGDPRLRPNQLLAVSLPHAPLHERSVVDACAPLLTSLGLRSLDPADPGYRGRHRGSPGPSATPPITRAPSGPG